MSVGTIVLSTMSVPDLWNCHNSSPFIEALQSGLSLQAFVDEHPEMFKGLLKTRVVCCDGRIERKGNEYFAAGSFILAPVEQLPAIMQKLKERGVTCLTSHHDCGAAGLAFSLAKDAGTVPHGITTADDYGRFKIKEMAETYGFSYEHIGPVHFNHSHHHERCLFIDATGKLDPTVADLPNSFVSHSSAFVDEYVGVEAKILSGIALGDHGFGDHITETDPFYVLVLSLSPSELAEVLTHARIHLQDHGNRVRVQGAILKQD